MAWKLKTIFGFGTKNLTGNYERLEALDQARDYLELMGFDSATVAREIQHEKDHLFAFPDFDEGSGKKLNLILQERPGDHYKLVVVPNRLHTRADVRNSLEAVDTQSEGDVNFGCLSRFRRR